VCGSPQVVPWKARDLARALEPDDLRITDHRYGTTLALAACQRCGFVFASDDEVGHLAALYQELADPDYEESQPARARQMQWLLRRARRVHPRARTLLDVGAGAGLLVAEARRAGLAAEGIEPSRPLVESARRLHTVELLPGTLPHPVLAHRRFDLVSLVDVLEHVADPVGLLAASAARLAPGGVLLLVTPDAGSVAARLLGRRWWHLRLAHVGYFNRRSLAAACARAGLVPLRRCRPTWFLPVGYLAERLGEYAPVPGLRALAGRVNGLGALSRRVIPLNLFDSFAVFLQRTGSTGPA
jgi:2-polyprenyl-3-methyl-5-hydroxy-6-metoxy-1,4-benzoquinol methylase